MFKRIWVVILLLLAIFVGVAHSVEVACLDTAAGVFVRGAGQPVVESRTFPGVAGPALFIIHNGAADNSLKRVSSSVITLNGIEIVTPDDFNQNVALVEVEVDLLEGDNQLNVQLQGKPGSTIEVEIVQEFDAEAAGFINSEGGFVEVTNSDSPLKYVRVVILNDTFDKAVPLTISVQQDIPPLPLPNGFIPQGEYISFEANGAKFEKPVAIELPIPDDLEPNEILILFTYDEENDAWKEVPPVPSPFDDKMVAFLEHFSTYVKGRKIMSWDSVRTGFAFGKGKDTLKFPNYDDVCRGMAHMASRYWNKWAKKEEEGLYCRWSESNERTIVSGLHAEIKDYDHYSEYINTVISMVEGLFINHDRSFDYIKLQSFLNKTVPLGLMDFNLFTSEKGCFHSVVSVGVDDLYSGKDITIYDVNDHTEEQEIKSGWFSSGSKWSNYKYEASSSCNYNLFFIESGLEVETDWEIKDNPSEHICNQTKKYTFSGAIDGAYGNKPSYFTSGMPVNGTIEYQGSEIIKFEFVFDEKYRIDLNDFDYLDDDPYLNVFHPLLLQVQAYDPKNSSYYDGYGLTYMFLNYDIYNDDYSFRIVFGDWPSYVYGRITGGTILRYPD